MLLGRQQIEHCLAPLPAYLLIFSPAHPPPAPPSPVLSALQRLCEARRVINQNILFLVPEYDGFKVSGMPAGRQVEAGRGAAVPPGLKRLLLPPVANPFSPIS